MKRLHTLLVSVVRAPWFQGRVPLLLAAVLSLAASAAHAASPQPLRLAIARTPLSLPMYVAMDKGFFAAEGLEVDVQECNGGHRCLKLVLDGQADIATTSDLPLVFNSFERTDYAVIGTIATSSDDNKLLAHARSGIRRPLHLAGKRVGAVTGASSQYFLELFLLTQGIDPGTQTVVPLQPEEMLPALKAGRVDAVAIWEPHAYVAAKALGSDAVILPTKGAYLLTFNLASHRRILGTRDTDLVKLLRAVERAERLIQDEPATAKAILRTRLQLDDAFVDWVWPGLGFRLGLDQALITTMEGEARWARRAGHVKGALSPNFLSLLYTQPLTMVKPTAVGVGR